MEPQHTPEPWTLGTCYGNHGVRIDGDNGNRPVCGVTHVERDIQDKSGRKVGTEQIARGWADARLITAAPALLRVAFMVVDGEYNDCDLRKAAESAIAKAMGHEG